MLRSVPPHCPREGWLLSLTTKREVIWPSACVRLLTEPLAEMRLRETLTRYMGPKLADKVIMDGSRLGGTSLCATVVFADMRAFTALSERLEPPALISALNEHFGGLISVVGRRDGIIDKFIGDCVMAGALFLLHGIFELIGVSVFGVPYPSPHDATNACEAILDMIAFLRDLGTRRQADGKPVLSFGIGCNTGVMVAGNLGTEDRMDFSVIGDAVNVASRIEGATKAYGVSCLISESTLQAADMASVLFREVDRVRVVGRSAPVRLFELLGRARDADCEANLALIASYHEGLRAYQVSCSLLFCLADCSPPPPL